MKFFRGKGGKIILAVVGFSTLIGVVVSQMNF